MTDLYQAALARALARDEKDVGIVGEPMIAAIAHASRVRELENEVDRLRAKLKEADRICGEMLTEIEKAKRS